VEYASVLLTFVVAMVPAGLLALKGYRPAKAVRGKVFVCFFRGWHPTSRRSPTVGPDAAVLDAAMASLLGHVATEDTVTAIAAACADPLVEVEEEEYIPW
jgi:hypothetical protein